MAKAVHKSAPVYFNYAGNVDKQGSIIKDVVIIQSGVDKYGDNFDETFLRSMQEQGNASAQGVKSRFGHPNMCKESLGTYLGRFKNFKIGNNNDGRQVLLADLHLDETAKSSPTNGNMYDYVMNMASKNDDMFGNSVVFIPAQDEVKIEKDVDGNDVKVPYIRLKSFLASDIVDSPAATDSLFRDYNQGNFAAKATEFLNENPEFIELIQANPQVVKDFTDKYLTTKDMKKSLIARLKELVTSEETVETPVEETPETPTEPETPETLEETPDEPSEAEKENEELKESVKSFEVKVTDLEKQLSDKQKAFDELEKASTELADKTEQTNKDVADMKSFLAKAHPTLKIPAENKTFARSASEAAAEVKQSSDKEALSKAADATTKTRK